MKITLSKIFFIVVCAALLFPFFSTNISNGHFYMGMDPSWMLALQYAFKNNLVFGEDVIFTYGPLFYFHLGQSVFIPKLYFVLSGCIQLTCLVIGLNLIFDKYKKTKPLVWLAVFFISFTVCLTKL